MTTITRKLIFTALLAVAGMLALALGSNSASATPVSCFGGDCTVSDGDASITFDGDGTDPELDDFSINGIDQLFEQEYHLCFTCTGANKFNVDLTAHLTLDSATQDEDTNLITAVLTGSGLKITIEHKLTGGTNSGTLENAITIENTSNSPITLTLTEYFDYDLGGGGGGDSGTFNASSDTFTQTDGGTSLSVTALSDFSGFDIGNCCETNILENAGLLGRTSAGPGDLAFALQYDLTINPVANWPVTFRTQGTATVPEPGTLGLFAFGLIGLGLARRRRRHAA